MKIKSLLNLLIAAALIVGSIPCVNSYASDEQWSDIYKEKLFEIMESDKYNEDFAFELYKLGTDEVPELIISEGDSSKCNCRIYTYYNNEFIELGNYGESGVIGYCPERHAILDRHYGNDWEFGVYYTLKNGRAFNRIFSYSNENDSAYRINNNISSYADYKEVLSKYESDNFKWLGRANKLDENGIYNAFMGDWREIYRDYLIEAKAHISSNYKKFELYDVNGDDIPELFLTDERGACSAYTVYGGSIDFLMKFESGIRVYPQKNQIITNSFYPHNQFLRTYLLNDGMLECINEFVSVAGKYDSAYSVNGEKVTCEEFADVYNNMYKYRNTRYIGTKYMLNDLGIENAFKTSQNTLTDRQKEIYARIIFSNNGFRNSYFLTKFDIYDIDGDDIPELIYSDSEHSKKIYKLNGDSVEEIADINSEAMLGFDDENIYLMNKDEYEGWTEGTFRKFSGGKISDVFHYSACASCGSHDDESEQNTMIYKLNDAEVTEEEYNAAVSAYENAEEAVRIGFSYNRNVYDVADIIFGEVSLINVAKSINCMLESFALCAEPARACPSNVSVE